ncbi:MAG: sigma-70 family RNA polymerase sigma factor [Spirochaetes bacterium]|nr:sigma-70 family RNA polymerase sigma factor [Spirochaetota bacterium]
MIIDDNTEIIKKIKKGDQESFNKIILKYQNPIFNYVFKMVYNIDDAMDITQDVFFKAYKNIRFFNFRSKFSTWLYKIAFNHALNIIKRKKNQKMFYDKFTENDSFYIDNGSKNFEDKEINNIVENILKTINPVYRTCIYLFYKEGMSYEEISEVMKLPLNTVRSHLKRGRESIRNILVNKYKIKGLYD